MKEFSGVLLKFVLMGVEVLGILIMRFGEKKISEYLRRLMRKRRFSINEHIILIGNSIF